MNKIHVYDVQFCKTDKMCNDIFNEDGSIKLFSATCIDHTVRYIIDDLNEDDLEELEL